MKRSVRRIKKDIKMGRDPGVQDLRLAKLPLPLRIRLSYLFGLVKEEYQAGETIVDMNSGDMIELTEPYKNGTRKIKYRNIWNFWRPANVYEREYDDDYGGTLTLCPCDMFFPADPLWKKYDHIYRLATTKECQLKK
jgi:hypothetical protein